MPNKPPAGGGHGSFASSAHICCALPTQPVTTTMFAQRAIDGFGHFGFLVFDFSRSASNFFCASQDLFAAAGANHCGSVIVVVQGLSGAAKTFAKAFSSAAAVVESS
jgi:hypothetical protein